MAGDGRPRHCGRRADEAWPRGPYAYLPRGGICSSGEPWSRRPVAAGSPPGHPAHRAAGQWRSGSDAASPPGPVPARGRAGPDRGPEALQIAGTRPEGRAGPRREESFYRVSAGRAGSVTRHPQAATARGDGAAGRRGGIADMTTLMLPADLAAVSSAAGRPARSASLPIMRCGVDGEFVAAGRRGTAGSGACPSLVFSCPGRVACGAPARSQIRALGRERSCRWPCRAAGGRAGGVAAGPRSASQPGRGNRAGQSPALAGSRTARTVPARPARQASPLGWRSRRRWRPVATVASSCHSRPRA